MIRRTFKAMARGFGFEIVRKGAIPQDVIRLRSDFSPDNLKEIRDLEPYTQTSPERLLALIRSVEYVVSSNIHGAIVECGVWKGGSMMAVAQTLIRLGILDRHLYLYDTYEGMTEPTEKDVSHYGIKAVDAWRNYRQGKGDESGLFEINTIPLEDVKKAIYQTGYDRNHLHFIKGKVEDTIPANVPERIAILRLDTDWYESTRHEMDHLFPLLSSGGVLIIDDYEEWKGCRQAIDEYIQLNQVSILLNRIDYTGRIGVKI